MNQMTSVHNSDAEGCGCSPHKSFLSVDEAVVAGLGLIKPIKAFEDVALVEALGRVLAHSVIAQSMTPPFDCAAMDGFAIRQAGSASDFPRTLNIQDQVAAGDGREIHLESNAAIRIFTGAPMPLGADTVVMQEHTVYGESHVRIARNVPAGEHVRRRGEDMKTGAIILPVGCRIRPSEIAVIAAAGHGTVSVTRRVRVALLTSGNEITTPGVALSGGKIWDVNTPMLVAALKQAGAEVITVTVNDDECALATQLTELSQTSDFIVTTGGVSVGNSDYLRPAFRKAGGEIHISGVAMKPGKPVCVGTLGNAVWLGLPGNPVAAFVVWQIIGAKLLAALQGSPLHQPCRKVLCQNPLTHKAGRCEFRPARIVGTGVSGLEIVACLPTVHSAQLTPLVLADGLIIIPAEITSVSPDEPLEFIEFTR